MFDCKSQLSVKSSVCPLVYQNLLHLFKHPFQFFGNYNITLRKHGIVDKKIFLVKGKSKSNGKLGLNGSCQNAIEKSTVMKCWTETKNNVTNSKRVSM